MFYIVARYVNISCQGVAFCDPTFRYGNDVKLIFEETEKSFSSLMWSGKDDIFRWITERSFSLILSLLMSFTS